MGHYKYMVTHSLDDKTITSETLYNLNKDPAEINPLAREHETVYELIKNELASRVDVTAIETTGTKQEALLDEQFIKQLNVLGYAQ
jgi:hypothetical protein